MSDEALIKKIVAALENALAEIVIAEHTDALNALTEVMIKTLKTVEYLSAPQAYRRAAEVFADAAIVEEAEVEKAAKETAAKAAAKRSPKRISTVVKFEQFKKRQARVAQRAKRALKKSEPSQ
jgi:hypothetical protein